MPREKENLEKVTIRLHKGDKDEIDDFYPRLGHNKIIRKLVSDHLKKLRANVDDKRNQTDEPASDPIDITLE